MIKDRKTFKLPPDEVKRIAREILELKDWTYEEVGDSAHASSPDGKKSYHMRFLEVRDGTEVSMTIERRRSLRGIFKKRDPFLDDEEMEGLWRLFELKMPKPEEGGLASFIEGFLRDINNGEEDVTIPEGFEVEALGGGMLKVKDVETGIAREVLLPKGTREVAIQSDRIRVVR